MNVMQRRMLDVLEQRVSFYEVLLAGKTRQGQTPVKVMSYVYQAQFINAAAVALATNTGIQTTVDTAGNCDFLMTYISAAVYNNATQAFISAPYSAWLFNDTFTQTTMMSAPTPVMTTTGGNGFPYLLQDPKLLPANTSMVISYYNWSTVGPIAHDAFFAFGGYKIFY